MTIRWRGRGTIASMTHRDAIDIVVAKKNALRRHMRELHARRRDATGVADLAVATAMLTQLAPARARLGIYHALPHELDVDPLRDLAPEVGRVCWVAPSSATAPIPRGIALDVVLVPAVALDRSGARLGHGGGWYDRAIVTMRSLCPHLLVVGCVPWWALREAGTIPIAAHDVRVDAVMTEKEWILPCP